MKRTTFIGCAVGVGQYSRQGNDYEEWIKYQQLKMAEHCPEIDRNVWIGQWPTNARPHEASPYGFKTHAFRWAIEQGYDQVIWMDSALYPIKSFAIIVERIASDGLYIVDGGERLNRACRQEVYPFLDITPDQVQNQNITSGQILGFDVHNPVARAVLELWCKAEAAGLFSIGQLANHRHDEACLGAILGKYQIPFSPWTEHYYSKNPHYWSQRVGPYPPEKSIELQSLG